MEVGALSGMRVTTHTEQLEDYCHHCRKWVMIDKKSNPRGPLFQKCPECKKPNWEAIARDTGMHEFGPYKTVGEEEMHETDF